MKFMFMALIIFFVSAAVSNAQEEEELIPDEVIEVKIPKEVIPDSPKRILNYDAVIIGGLGYTSGIGEFAPTLSIGFEIPFNNKHMTSFQLSSHIWRKTNEIGDESINSLNDFHDGYGLSGVFKFYILDDASDFRLSMHFGVSLFYDDYLLPCFDFGLGGYYRISKKISLSLDGRFNIWYLGLAWGIPAGPIITTLNVNYYLEW